MSLRLRLALWYGGLTGLIVLLVSLATYATHSRAHYDDLDHDLESLTVHLVEEHPEAKTPEQLTAVLSVPVAPDVVVQVYASDGSLLATSPNASQSPAIDLREVLAGQTQQPFDLVIGLAPPFIPVEAGPGRFGLALDSEDARWRSYVIPVDSGARYFLALSPLGRIDASVGRLRQMALLFTVLGAVLTFTGGRMLAGRALRPVADLNETAGAIARSQDFKRRVVTDTQRDELGRLAATFNQMLGSLEEAYLAQQRFVSDASHELRAPLTAIQANLELLERQPDMPAEECQEAIGEARRETWRLVSLVSDLLALARADAGAPLKRQRVELDRVLLDAFSQARHLARGQRLEVGDLGTAIVEGDPDRLKQLFLILLDNALKYTPSDGQVIVSLRRAGEAAEVVVRDTGVGIPTEALPHVFERFFRADPARTRDPGGTGLGLPIAKWIAQQHGGDIAITSELGRGTTVTVRLSLRG